MRRIICPLGEASTFKFQMQGLVTFCQKEFFIDSRMQEFVLDLRLLLIIQESDFRIWFIENATITRQRKCGMLCLLKNY